MPNTATTIALIKHILGVGSNAQGTNLSAGASGTAGTVNVYPTTAAKGKLTLTASDATGNTTSNVNIAAQAGARTYTIPDAGASASFLMTAGTTQTIAASSTLLVTDADKLKVGGVIIPQQIPIAWSGLATATAFLATAAYQLTAVSLVYSTAESTASNLRVQVTKDTGTDAPGAGTALLTDNTNAGLSVKATANTVQSGTLTGTGASLQLAAGNRLAIKFETTKTELAGLIVALSLKRI